MKSIYTTILSFSFLILSFSTLFAQKDVVIQFNHYLNETPFAFSQEAKTNLDYPFDVTRLEYYLSKISIIHDGGQETLLEDVYVLAQSGEPTIIEANGLNVTSVEGVSFHVGVDDAVNHLDPASWPTDHALYPKFPSMHWGWSAGYRFVAMEGFAGPNVNSLYQFHGLGDKNYFKISVLNNAVESDGKDYVYIDADYSKALQDMNMSTGVISHGETDEAKQVLLNFRDYVFTAGSAPSSIFLIDDLQSFNVFPNPISGSNLYIDGLQKMDGNIIVQVLDITGKKIICNQFIQEGILDVSNIENSGFYVLQIWNEGKLVGTNKLMKF